MLCIRETSEYWFIFRNCASSSILLTSAVQPGIEHLLTLFIRLDSPQVGTFAISARFTFRDASSECKKCRRRSPVTPQFFGLCFSRHGLIFTRLSFLSHVLFFLLFLCFLILGSSSAFPFFSVLAFRLSPCVDNPYSILSLLLPRPPPPPSAQGAPHSCQEQQ